MSEHTSAVFNNSCLKVPLHPRDKKPYPVYEQKLINELENKARKLSIDCTRSPESNKGTLKSFIDFYDSIPEYDDVNHLSNRDFYRKLENLKEKQRSYFDYLQHEFKYENRKTGWIDEYKGVGSKEVKPFCTTPILIKSRKNDDIDSVGSFEKELNKPPSRRSVRIESPGKDSPETTSEYFRSKSRAEISSAGSKRVQSSSHYNDSILGDFSDLEKEDTLTTKSAPTSPRKSNVAWKDGITIPKPFQMTVRDEENAIVEEILIKEQKPEPEEKHQMFKANPIPVESQIPLFDKIMYDQEMRRQVVKKRSKENLRSQMRPFSFTRREEEIQAITKRLSKSSPSLFLNDDRPAKVRHFKAKPVPKNLFSNYIYRKMHEDEYYRALQRKIRAEEMLKAASLPPAMEKRERHGPKYHICPRSCRDVELDDQRLNLAHSNSKQIYRNLDKELAELELDFIMSSPSPKPGKSKSRKKGRKVHRKSSSDSKSSRSESTLESVNRSNLASVLRIQSARKRLENEMARRLEQVRIREESRWREKVMRKRPVWQALTYSHEEDLKMRLQMRRDEEQMRKEEHYLRMQSMLGRVNQQPTLFERQSQARLAKTREELISKLYKNMGRHSANSKLSSSDISDRRCIEMKDEAIQAQFDELFKDEEKAAISGEAEADDETDNDSKDC